MEGWGWGRIGGGRGLKTRLPLTHAGRESVPLHKVEGECRWCWVGWWAWVVFGRVSGRRIAWLVGGWKGFWGEGRGFARRGGCREGIRPPVSISRILSRQDIGRQWNCPDSMIG